jgi:glycerol-3-phosphate dehydrogenase
MPLSPQSTDVLIIGGIIGCSIVYFLRTRGVEVLVVEPTNCATSLLKS